MIVNAVDPEELRIATVKDGSLEELQVEISNRETYLGNIYKGRVVNIEPSIGAAFVNFGGSRNGFLHASDVLPAYTNPIFKLVDIVEGRARAQAGEGPDVVRAVMEDDDEPGSRPAPPQAVGGEPGGGVDLAGGQDAGAPLAYGADAAVASDFQPTEVVHAAVVPEPEPEPESEPLPEPPEVPANEDPDVVPVEPLPVEGDVDGADAASAPEAGLSGEGPAMAAAEAVTEAAGAVAPPGRPSRRERHGRGGGGYGGFGGRPRLPIQQLLRKGQEVVVQITKEGIGAKGPTLTTYLSLPGRCLVLMPSLPKCGVSRKIEDDRERRRLKAIVRQLDETGSGGIGFIVRTAGVDKSAKELQLDLEYLKKIWEVLVKRVKNTKAPAPLYEESDLVLKCMRDLFSPDVDEIVVDSEPVYLRVREFLEKLMPAYVERVRLHSGEMPIFHTFGIEKQIESLYEARIELKMGGSIVVEQTEALVAIDVNSGKYKPGADLEDTAYRTNLEAIPEIVRHLRLRDLGGVIIIDFIDMNDEKHRRNVERRFRDELKDDKARIKIGRISIFGMLELTRQRVGPGLKKTVFNPCPTCKGTSLVRTVQSKALAVLREVRAICTLPNFIQVEVYSHPDVAVFLSNRKRRDLQDVEGRTGRTVFVKGEQSYPVDVVHYRFLNAIGQEVKVNIPAGLGVKP